jgi:glycosyltransferase involved in cell wall biosynthesis
MKINWFSNAPWAATGYGNQTKLFTPRIKALGYDVAISALYGLQGSVMNWGDVQVFPLWDHQYGMDIIASHTRQMQADIVLSLFDAWTLPAEEFKKNDMRWCPWFPVDCEPLPLAVYRQVKDAYQPIVFSQSALKQAQNFEVDALYVPHGVNAKLFAPGDKQAARAKLNLPTDKFIVGMVAANKDPADRKALFQQIEAFALFHRKHADTALHLHTYSGDIKGGPNALNLPEFAEYHGLKVGEDVLFCDQYGYVLGFSDEYMIGFYNALDVLLNVSKGEGFGIPILEAQACGTPVIIGGWTAMEELCFGGWSVERSEADRQWVTTGGYMFTPRIGAIVDRLEAAYKNRRHDKIGQLARAGALAYDADTVTMQYWKPVLESIAARVQAEQQPPAPDVVTL